MSSKRKEEERYKVQNPQNPLLVKNLMSKKSVFFLYKLKLKKTKNTNPKLKLLEKYREKEKMKKLWFKQKKGKHGFHPYFLV
jgi:hypothetical protein